MTNGIVNVYKEKGFTSFDVVAKLRGIFHQKKIGHTGTLDPDAEGVLPVCLGSATKVCGLLTDKDKEYEAVLLLGVTTDTQDAAGTVLAQREVSVSGEEAAAAIFSFTGDIMQVPPMYSALKVGGKKLCDLAREGVTVERRPRPVSIYRIEILDMQFPRVHMRIHCSKGTYIRTLCHDIGEKLGCGGCMESLLRTRVSEFVLADALKLSEIERAWTEGRTDFLRSVDSLFVCYPAVTAQREAQRLIDNGNRIPAELVAEKPQEEMLRLYDAGGRFVGLYTYEQAAKDYKPVKLFFDR
ncbi:MAG: tRNA pseudouridine(55) synthase TruB [Muribaculaceae bacterium]|nr:tRNA pseudouridine(55) synthase TruB [Roseburia sp.]MCM1431002.1 tRNA pseudouridine(55) synthase TruB [Muribaculaceae bacterium]MCM1493764.1 tRNA pseudouridine(55) synthase TruB [Muribaculaceae bacterium]